MIPLSIRLFSYWSITLNQFQSEIWNTCDRFKGPGTIAGWGRQASLHINLGYNLDEHYLRRLYQYILLYSICMLSLGVIQVIQAVIAFVDGKLL